MPILLIDLKGGEFQAGLKLGGTTPCRGMAFRLLPKLMMEQPTTSWVGDFEGIYSSGAGGGDAAGVISRGTRCLVRYQIFLAPILRQLKSQTRRMFTLQAFAHMFKQGERHQRLWRLISIRLRAAEQYQPVWLVSADAAKNY